MKKIFKGIISVFRREFHFLAGDFNMVLVIFLAPVLYMVIYGGIYLYKGESELPVCVISTDNSEYSRLFIRYLDASQMLSVDRVERDFGNHRDNIYGEKVFGTVYIPEDFGRLLKSGRGASIKLFLNTDRFLISNDINKAVNEVVGTMNAGILQSYMRSKGLSADQANIAALPVTADMKQIGNPTETYGGFLLPGLTMFILTQILIVGFSMSIAKEREESSLAALYEASGRSIMGILFGKWLFYCILFSIFMLFSMTVVYPWLHLPVKGSIVALIAVNTLMLSAAVFQVLPVSSLFTSKVTAMQFIVFSSYPLLLVSGYSWPLFAMPPVVRYIAYMLPISPYLSAFTRITQAGAGFSHVLPELGHLLILCLAGIAVSYLSLKRLVKEQ